MSDAETCISMHAIGISTAGIIGPGGTPDRQELITLVKRTIAARSTEEVGDAEMGDFEADEEGMNKSSQDAR